MIDIIQTELFVTSKNKTHKTTNIHQTTGARTNRWIVYKSCISDYDLNEHMKYNLSRRDLLPRRPDRTLIYPNIK